MKQDRLRQIVEQAKSKPPEERRKYLEQVCGDSAGLLARLEALVQTDDDTPTPPSRLSNAAPPDRAEVLEKAGDVIHRYKLLQQIGEGGMGTVWMAEQFEPVRRKVALKIIKLGMDTKQVVARFEAERQALALMDHPGIAKVLDGGMTDGGRPYFVMELVKGVPITEFCDEAKFDITRRLELFTQVCRAVQHAHQKGIIHRDLKPSNVMVTLHDGEPVPKVIDFGIAKATNQQLTQKTMFTEYQQILGTPEYMAPEQASMSGLDVDTRADVYSLGVLLYELLTGTKPFDLKTLMTQGYAEVLRTIREEDPPKPSTRASTADGDTGKLSMVRQLSEGQLGRTLRGDLDWIVVKSMEKDRTRRYDTANGLAMDIERFLTDEAVLATPPSAAYRMRKFVRRNRGPVAAAVLVAAALVAGMIGTGIGIVTARAEARRAERAEEATARELARATEVKAVVKGMLVGISPEEAQGADTTLLKGIVDKTAARLDQGEIEDELIAAELHLIVGYAYQAIGEFEAAERHFPRSIEIRERLLGPEHRDTLESRTQMGILRSGQGAYREAARIQEELLPIITRVAGPEDKFTIGHMVNLATSRMYLHDMAGANELMEEAYATARRVLGEEEEFTLTAAGNYGLILRAMGRREDAETMYRNVLEVRNRIDGPDHPALLATKMNLALCLIDDRRYEEAERLLVEVRERQEKVSGPEHPRTLTVLMSQAQLAHATGRSTEAEELLDRVAEVAARELSPEHPLSLEISQTRAAVYLLQGRHPEAIRLTVDSVAIARRVLGERSPRALNYLEKSGNTLAVVGRTAEAHELFLRVHEVRREHLGPDHEKTLLAALNVAGTAARTGRGEEAEALVDEAHRRLQEKFGPDDLRTRHAELVRARVIGTRGRWEEAAALYRAILDRPGLPAAEAAELWKEVSVFHFTAGRIPDAAAAKKKEQTLLRQLYPTGNMRIHVAQRELGFFAHCMGLYPAAIQHYGEAIEGLRETMGADHPIIVGTECMLAISWGGRKRFDEAERILLEAQARAERLWGRGHLVTIDTYSRLGMVYMDAGRMGDAKRVLAIAIEARKELTGVPPSADLERLALIAQSEGELVAAERYYREAIQASKQSLGETHPATVQVILGLADLLRPTRPDEAETFFVEALDVIRQTMPETHPSRINALRGLAGVRIGQGRRAEAVSLLEELIEVSGRVHGEDAPVTLSISISLGQSLNALGRHDEAERILQKGLEAAEKKMGSPNPMSGSFLVMLAGVHTGRGDWAKAEEHYRSANAAYLRFQGPAAIPTRVTNMLIAWTLQESDRFEEALKLYEPTCAGLRVILPPDHDLVVGAIAGLVKCYDELGRTEDAAPLLKDLVDTQRKRIEVPKPKGSSLHALAGSLLLENYPETYAPKQALELARRAYAMEKAAKGGDQWRMLVTIARAEVQSGEREKGRKTMKLAIAAAPAGHRPKLEKRLAEEFAE